MAMLDINWKPSNKELRQFAGLCLVIFGGIGAWGAYQNGLEGHARWFLIAAAALGVPGLLVPPGGATGLRRLDGSRIPDRLDGFAPAARVHFLRGDHANRLDAQAFRV